MESTALCARSCSSGGTSKVLNLSSRRLSVRSAFQLRRPNTRNTHSLKTSWPEGAPLPKGSRFRVAISGRRARGVLTTSSATYDAAAPATPGGRPYSLTNVQVRTAIEAIDQAIESRCYDKCMQVLRWVGAQLPTAPAAQHVSRGRLKARLPVVCVRWDKTASIKAAGQFTLQMKTRHQAILDLAVRSKSLDHASAYIRFFPANQQASLYQTVMLGYRDRRDYQQAKSAFDIKCQAGFGPYSRDFCLLIQAAGRAGKLSAARRLYVQAREEGIFNTFVGNAFIDACSRCYEMEEAQATVAQMEREGVHVDVTTFNTLIAGAARCGSRGEDSRAAAEVLLQQMRARQLEPTERTYGAMLAAVAAAQHVDVGRASKLLQDAEQAGFRVNNHMVSSFITACARADPPEEAPALAVCTRLRASGLRPNSQVYAALLTLCSTARNPALALDVAESMRQERVGLGAYSMTALLAACKRGSAQQAGAALDIFLRQRRVHGKTIPCNAALALCLEQEEGLHLEQAMQIFERMEAPDVITFNTLLRGCTRHDAWGLPTALELKRRMEALRIRPTERTFVALLSCAARAKARADTVATVEALLLEMKRTGIAPNTFVYTSVMDSYAKNSQPEKALEVFEEMKRAGVPRTVVTYGCLLDACIKAGDADAALRAYSDMYEAGVQPNDFCHNLLIMACSREGYLNEMMDWMKDMFRRGRELSADTFESVVMALCDARYVERALRVLSWMQSKHHRPSKELMVCMVQSLCADGHVEWARNTYLRMRELGHSPDTRACSAVIILLSQGGQLQRAIDLHNDLPAPPSPPKATSRPGAPCSDPALHRGPSSAATPPAAQQADGVAGGQAARAGSGLYDRLVPGEAVSAGVGDRSAGVGARMAAGVGVAAAGGAAGAADAESASGRPMPARKAEDRYARIAVEPAHAEDELDAYCHALCHLVIAASRAAPFHQALQYYSLLRSCRGQGAFYPSSPVSGDPSTPADPGGKLPAQLADRNDARDAQGVGGEGGEAGDRAAWRTTDSMDNATYGKMFEALMEACCRGGGISEALEVFDDMKAQGPRILVSTSSLAYLQSTCRQHPAHEWRMYDVCAHMRLQTEEKKKLKEAFVQKTCHHYEQDGSIIADGRIPRGPYCDFEDAGDASPEGSASAQGEAILSEDEVWYLWGDVDMCV